MDNEKTNVPNNELKELVETIARSVNGISDNLVAFQEETRGLFHEVRRDITELQKDMFTEEEKGRIISLVDHYEEWLNEDTRGKDRITLKRVEYDKTAKAVSFPNRFEQTDDVL